MLNSNCWSTRANCGGILINYVKKTHRGGNAHAEDKGREGERRTDRLCDFGKCKTFACDMHN